MSTGPQATRPRPTAENTLKEAIYVLKERLREERRVSRELREQLKERTLEPAG